MVLLDRLSSAGSFNIITVVTIRINHIYPMTRVMTPESSEICAMRHLVHSRFELGKDINNDIRFGVN